MSGEEASAVKHQRRQKIIMAVLAGAMALLLLLPIVLNAVSLLM